MKLNVIFEKYKGLILYIIFGALTTLVNFVCYSLLYETGLCSNITSTIIAWLAATIFAFITNKLFVFKSHSKALKDLIYELGSFYFFRIATGICDVLIMWIAVDIMNLNAPLFKLISNVLVIILNYIASKLVIFKNK